MIPPGPRSHRARFVVRGLAAGLIVGLATTVFILQTRRPANGAGGQASPSTGVSAEASPANGVAGQASPAAEIDVEPEMRPWVYAGPNPQSWWCEMPDCTPDFDVDGRGPMPTIDAELADIHALGARYAGIGVPWPLIETSPGTFDWSRLDAIVAAARHAGVTLEPRLVWTPEWAGGGPQLDQPPPQVSDWTTFVTDVVRRYPQDFPYLEVWNEPDGGQALACSGADCERIYVDDLLNPAYAAIKAADPRVQVVMAGSANDAGACCTYITRVLGDGAQFDVATFHNYAGTFGSEASRYRTILDAHGHSGTQLWMSEFGVKSNLGDQAAALRQVFAGKLPIQLAGWYNLRDTDAWTCCPPADILRGHWGVLNADFSPKPAYATLQALLGGRGEPEAPSQVPAASQHLGPGRLLGSVEGGDWRDGVE